MTYFSSIMHFTILQIWGFSIPPLKTSKRWVLVFLSLQPVNVRHNDRNIAITEQMSNVYNDDCTIDQRSLSLPDNHQNPTSYRGTPL